MGIIGAFILDLICNILILICLILVLIISVPMMIIIGICSILGNIGEVVREIYLWILNKTTHLIKSLKETEDDVNE